MRPLVAAILPWALALAGGLPQRPAPATPPAHPPISATSASKTWLGHEGDIEQFLRTGKILRIEEVPVGVTRPLRGYLAPGGPAGSFIFKPLQPGMVQGYFESYQSEIAAYELDKLLGLGMVPPTIERRISEWGVGSVQLWIENVRLVKDTSPNEPRDTARWYREVYRHRVFDDLVGNIDRNTGNLLVDADWNLILIDHSRAFTGTREMPFKLERIDRVFLERLRALTEDQVKRSLGTLLFDGPKPLLRRRQHILDEFDRLIAEKGEAAVVIP